jgi:hypothetical protein
MKSDLINSIAALLHVRPVSVRWLDKTNNAHLEALRDMIAAALKRANGTLREDRIARENEEGL